MKPSPGHTTGHHLPTLFVLPKGTGRVVGKGPPREGSVCLPSPTGGMAPGEGLPPAFFLAWAHLQPEGRLPPLSSQREGSRNVVSAPATNAQARVPGIGKSPHPRGPVNTASGSPWPGHPPPSKGKGLSTPQETGPSSFPLQCPPLPPVLTCSQSTSLQELPLHEGCSTSQRAGVPSFLLRHAHITATGWEGRHLQRLQRTCFIPV